MFLFTHWLNFPGELHQTAHIEIGLSYAVLIVAGVAFFWRWSNPLALHDLNGLNILYFFLVLSLAPLVSANGYFGGLVTFPLEEEANRGLYKHLKDNCEVHRKDNAFGKEL
ncbi:MAG: hypothetical protein ACOZFS_12735 [Thermodesulfobacteriota bacterium]